jgi:GNAT superfamily N-acetyltransferase
VTIRPAALADQEQVLDLEMRLIRFDMHFGGAVWRTATPSLVRAEVRSSLARGSAWTWLAERGGRAVGLLVVQPPQEAGWIAGMTSRSPAAYLQTMFVDEHERGTGIGSALVRHLHARLDSSGVEVTLLHHSQVNPLSGPFWYRMGYRPLWTSWEARPAGALR